MKGSDYIVSVIKKNNVTDVFGYPGATVCHLMDSLEKEDAIVNHLNYHEQACAFAACGYAQSSGRIGVAYANGGPGFTNLITGIANAYYDSIPTVFICGQVDTADMVGARLLRQNGIQEIPISAIASKFVKEAIFVDSPDKLCEAVNRAFELSKSGRPGPILLEIPANVQRAEIEIYESVNSQKLNAGIDINVIKDMLEAAERPCLLVGNGVKLSGLSNMFRKAVDKLGIPVVFTLPAFDLLPFESKYNFGYVGNNGCRYSNYILEKSDLIVSVAARLDVKVTGKEKKALVHNAKLIRIDIDRNELSEKIVTDEVQINMNAEQLFEKILSEEWDYDSTMWLNICENLKRKLYGYDFKNYHFILQKLFSKAADDASFTADVGHHEIYMAQSLKLKEKQRALFSLGLASMGYSLPAAIGAYYGTRSQVISLSGDGGIQMNIQELQFIARENIPVKVVIFNNHSLGMVREFQERNFNHVCSQTTDQFGYTTPVFSKIANAYGIKYTRIEDHSIGQLEEFEFDEKGPELVELVINEPTYLYPRYIRGKRICDMEPQLNDKIKEYVETL